MAGNTCLFDGTIICGVLVVLLLPTCFSVSPINKDNTKTDTSASCKVGFDCCEFCSTRDDCIYWLNCCDRDKNEQAKRLLNMDCVSIVDLEMEELNYRNYDEFATVVKCPNGTLCERGTFVAGENFVFISEACAVCNQEDVYTQINISFYGQRTSPFELAQDTLDVLSARAFLVETKYNEGVPIRYCNTNLLTKNRNLGTMCKNHHQNNEFTCHQFSVLPSKFMFCHTCSGYKAFECKGGGQRGLSGDNIAYGYVVNSFHFAELIGRRIEYDGQAMTDDVCPNGHVLSLSKVRCNLSLII